MTSYLCDVKVTRKHSVLKQNLVKRREVLAWNLGTDSEKVEWNVEEIRRLELIKL